MIDLENQHFVCRVEAEGAAANYCLEFFHGFLAAVFEVDKFKGVVSGHRKFSDSMVHALKLRFLLI